MCGYQYPCDFVDSLGHDRITEVWYTDTHCNGQIGYFCTRCDEIWFEYNPDPEPHDIYVVSEIPATCTQDGCITFGCSKCDFSYYEFSQSLDHDMQYTYNAPTCTEMGRDFETCSQCGYERIIHTYSPLGCSFENSFIVPPTETEYGYTVYACIRCTESYHDNFVAPVIPEETEPTEPEDTQPTEPEPTEPEDTQPTEPEPTEPEETQPTEPEPTEPEDTQPTEPDPTEPEDTQPTEPDPTEPEDTQPTEPGEPDEPDEPVANAFHDVKSEDYFYNSVLWAVKNKITNGTGEGLFSPDQKCTRNQVVTFLWRSAGEPEPESTNNPFVDVAASDYFYKAVLWAVEKGITNGMDETHFGSQNECTRAQVATFLWRAQGKPKAANANHPFTDIKSGDYFYEAVLWAVEAGVTNGMTPTTFAPNDTCTRGQIVTFLYRALK